MSDSNDDIEWHFNGEDFGKAVAPALEVLENLKKQVTAGLSRIVESSGFKEFLSYLDSLPKDIKESWVYQETASLEKRKDLQLEDVLWIPQRFDLNSLHVAVENINNLAEENKINTDGRESVESYVISIINSKRINKKEKLVLLLSHMEPLIYDAMGMVRKKRESVKRKARNYTDSKNKVNMDAIEAVYVLAITYVVFSDTDEYTRPVDHRLPFRNNILHRGIVGYTEQEIKTAYEYLVECIAILLLTIAQKKNGVWEQKVFSMNL